VARKHKKVSLKNFFKQLGVVLHFTIVPTSFYPKNPKVKPLKEQNVIPQKYDIAEEFPTIETSNSFPIRSETNQDIFGSILDNLNLSSRSNSTIEPIPIVNSDIDCIPEECELAFKELEKKNNEIRQLLATISNK
jgi:hypothetical protein